MNRITIVLISTFIMLALAMPSFGGTAPAKRSTDFSQKVYNGGVSVAQQSENVFSGCLKTVFSFFNPCLDMVKGCTNVVMRPIDSSFGYVEKKIYKKPRARKVVKKKAAEPAKAEPAK
jgi:hypothetical protein